MNRYHKWRESFYRSRISFLTLTFLLTLAALPAFAGLGGDVSTVQADQVHMQGNLRITPSSAFTVHEIELPSGVVVREYASPSGKIFAVAWHGPWMPDMQQLLGDYFQRYVDAAQAQVNEGPERRPLHVAQPGFVLEQYGHMRSFTGRAYVPELIPPGVLPEAIR
jgi:Protein of unknown function (DUF2844)